VSLRLAPTSIRSNQPKLKVLPFEEREELQVDVSFAVAVAAAVELARLSSWSKFRQLGSQT
jgi:hypothetical protein